MDALLSIPLIGWQLCTVTPEKEPREKTNFECAHFSVYCTFKVWLCTVTPETEYKKTPLLNVRMEKTRARLLCSIDHAKHTKTPPLDFPKEKNQTRLCSVDHQSVFKKFVGVRITLLPSAGVKAIFF